MSDVCSFSKCQELNEETHMFTIDYFGHHWFCREHWKFIEWFFNNLVGPCVRNNDTCDCSRNHHAQFDSFDRRYETVKAQNKWFDLCDEHLATYDELLGIAVIADYTD